jgi:DNA ligase (NAD+)
MEQLLEIHGFGEAIASALHTYFENPENCALFNAALGIITPAIPSGGGAGTLSGLTFVITGDVQRFKNRKELSNFIESCGGRVSGSVSAKTSYLINNDATSTSGKNKKARELGIPIISESEFQQKWPST